PPVGTSRSRPMRPASRPDNYARRLPLRQMTPRARGVARPQTAERRRGVKEGGERAWGGLLLALRAKDLLTCEARVHYPKMGSKFKTPILALMSLSLARVWTTGQLVDERPDSPPVEGKEVPQLDDVDPALAGFALGYERLGPVQLPSD